MRTRTPSLNLTMLLALPLLLAAGACDDPVSGPQADPNVSLQVGNALLAGEADVTLRAEVASPTPGAVVELTLENGSDERVGYNLCFHALEQASAGGWQAVGGPQVCTTELRMLDTGASASFETTLPGDLQDGTYRYRTALYLVEQEVQRDVTSVTFQVGS